MTLIDVRDIDITSGYVIIIGPVEVGGGGIGIGPNGEVRPIPPRGGRMAKVLAAATTLQQEGVQVDDEAVRALVRKELSGVLDGGVHSVLVQDPEGQIAAFRL